MPFWAPKLAWVHKTKTRPEMGFGTKRIWGYKLYPFQGVRLKKVEMWETTLWCKGNIIWNKYYLAKKKSYLTNSCSITFLRMGTRLGVLQVTTWPMILPCPWLEMCQQSPELAIEVFSHSWKQRHGLTHLLSWSLYCVIILSAFIVVAVFRIFL